MLAVVIVLIFLLGWPFEWPAIILVFLPIFYPVIAALKFDLIWFGALVAVTLQTAYLSPPVAMSAYYLKQVVRGWSLATIYKGMMEFMVLQCVAVGMVLFFPAIATYLPEQLQEASRREAVEQIKDDAPSLEQDTMEHMQEQSKEQFEGEQREAPEKGDEKAPAQPK